MPFGGLLTAGILGFGGSLFSGIMGSSAAESAAQTQAQSAANALAFQKQEWTQQQQNMQPWLTAGFDPNAAGIGPAPAPFSYSAADFQADPGYAFALSEGQKAIANSAAAKGGSLSGAAVKNLDQYTVGMADQEYNQAETRAQGVQAQNFNQYLQTYQDAFNTFETNQGNAYNRLSGVSNEGLTAVQTLGQEGAQAANTVGNTTEDQGNALAAGTVGSANALTSGISGATNAVTGDVNAINNYNNQQQIQKLLEAYQQNGSGYSAGGFA